MSKGYSSEDALERQQRAMKAPKAGDEEAEAERALEAARRATAGPSRAGAAARGAILCIDTSEVREGKLGDLKEALRGLVAFVAANEPRTIAYRVHLTQDGRHMTVVQVHPDSASMEFHMKVAGPAFPKFADLVKLSAMDVYGEPSEELLSQLRRKAQLLGGVPVRVHPFHAGFLRQRDR